MSAKVAERMRGEDAVRGEEFLGEEAAGRGFCGVADFEEAFNLLFGGWGNGYGGGGPGRWGGHFGSWAWV